MTEGAPHILIVLIHRHNVDYFVPLASALERRGARVSFLSTDYSVAMAAWKRGRRAPNVMHTTLAHKPPKHPPEDVDLEDVVRYVINHPSIHVDRRTLFEQADRFVRACAAHFDRLRPDLVIVWGGTKPRERAAMKLAESRGIATIYFEQGNFPHTVVADPKGVNWEGSLNGAEVPREFDRERIDRWLEQYRSRPAPVPRAPGALAETLRVLLLDALVNFLVRRSPFHPTLYFDHDRRVNPRRFFRRLRNYARLLVSPHRSMREEMVELPERFVFVPLQVHDDTQVIVHSPRMRTMEELVDAVIEALPDGWDLVVKTHPADEGRRRYDVIEERLARPPSGTPSPVGTRGEASRGAGPRFHFFHRADTTELVRRAGAVVTLNSSVGLEGIALLKPVVVLGDAVYAGRGLTVDVPDPEQLPLALARALRFRPDEDEVRRFLDFFVFGYSKPGDIRNSRPEDLDAMADYVLAQLPAGKPPPAARRPKAEDRMPKEEGKRQESPLVSVIMPAYNVERYLGDAVRSVLAQTHANWELVIVDDGSTDRTGDVARSFTDPRIRHIRTGNRGPSAARNTGIAATRGEFVAFLDADDLWFPDKLAVQLKVFEDDPEAGLVYSVFECIDEEGRRLPRHRFTLDRMCVGRCLARMLVRNDIRTPTVMVRRRVIERAGRFPEEIRGGEDWELWRRAAMFGKFAVVPRVLAAVRLGRGTLSRQGGMMHEDLMRVIERGFADPEVRRRFSPGHLDRLRREAMAVRFYSRGCQRVRSGDLSGATADLLDSMRWKLHDFRQIAMLAMSLALRVPFISRRALFDAVKRQDATGAIHDQHRDARV